MSCWAESVVDPFLNGPCRIPDDNTFPTCAYTSLVSDGALSITDAANTNTVGGVMLFSANPTALNNFAAFGYDSATTSYPVAGATAYGAPNETGLMPVLSPISLMAQYRVRLTAMAVTITPVITGTMFTGLRFVTGYLRLNTASSSNDLRTYSALADITGGPGEWVNALSERREIPFNVGQPVTIAYKFSKVPEFIIPYTSTGATVGFSTNSLIDTQAALAVGLFGTAANGATVAFSFQCVYHWEVIPPKPAKMVTLPERSLFDPSAVADGMNRQIVGRPTIGSFNMSPVDTKVWGGF